MRLIQKGWAVVGWLAACHWGLAELPDVTEQAAEELGSTYGAPQLGGFVFIDGRYVAPPYTVTRKGNGIFINRIQVEQPVAWPRGGGAEAAAAGRAAAKKAIDADGDFEAVDPDPAPAPALEPEKAKAAKGIDDLFADEAEPAAEAPAAAKPDAPAPAPVAAAALPPQDAAREKAQAVEAIERVRKGYEQALGRGEIFFFGQRHHRVNGTYGTGRALMGVLPNALRYAVSAQELQQRLQQGGVYFVDAAICAELFRNKTTFPLLAERLRKIEESEALEAQKRKPARVW